MRRQDPGDRGFVFEYILSKLIEGGDANTLVCPGFM